MKEQSRYFIIYSAKYWFLPSKGRDYWHREDGPAVEYGDGSKSWWVNDKRHRIDGPAIELVNGTKEWCIDGKRIPTKEVEAWLEENDVDLKTPEGQMAFKLRWG